MSPNNLQHLQADDEVAVMPIGGNSPQHVLKTTRIQSVGRTHIKTRDGGIFAASNGQDRNLGHTLYIEPATESHRWALRQKFLLRRDW
jgi:hypothetical protein